MRIVKEIFPLILCIAAAVPAENSRFFRILKLYSDPQYQASDRKFFSIGDYYSRTSDTKPRMPGFTSEGDRTQTFERNMSGDFGISGIWLSGDCMKTKEIRLRTGVQGRYQCTSNVRSNSFIERSDILEYLDAGGGAYCRLDRRTDRYFGSPRGRKWFLGLDAQSNFECTADYSRLYEDYNLDYDFSSLEKNKDFIGAEIIDLDPSIGLGKPVFVTPVYRAFEIERALRESGVVKGDLSDETMVQIAHWLAAEFSVTATRDRPVKYVYAILDTILSRDSSVVHGPFTAKAVMNAAEKHDNYFPFLWNGFKLSFSGNVQIRVAYEDFIHWEGETRYRGGAGFVFDETNQLLNMELIWGKAFSSHFFISLGISSHPFWEGSLIDFSDENIAWINGSGYYLVNDRIYIELAMEELPLGISPIIEQPCRTSLTGRYFIENDISFTVSLVHENYLQITSFGSPDNRTLRTRQITDKINLGVLYDF